MLSSQVVIDTLTPEERLVHHPVAFGSVQLCRCSVRILVAVHVIQRIIGHLAVSIVHCGICICYVHLSGSRNFGDLGQDTVTLAQYGRDMTARHISVTVFVPSLIVEVADIRIIGNVIIELYHRIFRLADVQLIETLSVLAYGILVQILRQAVCAHKLAS